MSAAADHHGPYAALRQLTAFTLRQAALSAVFLLLLAVTGFSRQEYAWLALFAALLTQCGVSLACLRLLGLVLPRDASWSWCWTALPLVLMVGACLAELLYSHLTLPWLLPALSASQLLVATLCFGAAVIALPLLNARRQANALQLADLRQAALSAELKSLQAQVEPHFLYNTLANTRYLMRHEPDKAVAMLDHLIAYLRTALPDMRAAMSTAGRELELASHYLSLMAIRYGDRLSTSIDCPAALRDAAMPPLMLMSLVENAVQHGLEPKPGAVHIAVQVREEQGSLHVLVSDTGAGPGVAVLGSGVGLRNVRERLQALYGEGAAFTLRAGEGATEALLQLPLQRETT
ncbi:sensor histidine kinase [Pseudoduganella sp. UC29_106]|uniref:sensor histidine kinase n=1 Tax=Pseudoduganella sp. UC29_106 TaxID=3374553 RepID=UPI003757636D